MSEKYAFIGSTNVSRAVFSKLIDAGFKPALFVTTPDKPKGRKKVITPTPVADIADLHKIPVIKTKSFDDDTKNKLRSFKLDAFVVTSYPLIIPGDVIEIPRIGVLNVHFSLLPQLRGGSPVRSAILQGLNTTGTTIFQMDEKLDHGDILVQSAPTEVGNRTYRELEDELIQTSVDLLLQNIHIYVSSEATLTKQDHSKATKAPLFVKQDYFVSPKVLFEATKQEVEQAYRQVRAFCPDPGLWTLLQTDKGEERLKIVSAHPENTKLAPDVVVPAGKNEMPWKEYLRSRQITT